MPPYEYEYERWPIDLILGDQQVRLRLEGWEPVDAIESSWQEDLTAYDDMRRKYFLYEA
jgi:uncharacterized protein YbbC (DUF1343 family)